MIEKTNSKTKAVTNVVKRSSVANYLINNIDCANNYKLSKFKVIKHCSNLTEIIGL